MDGERVEVEWHNSSVISTHFYKGDACCITNGSFKRKAQIITVKPVIYGHYFGRPPDL